MKKLLTVSAFIATLHFIEDITLVSIGRYTDIDIKIVLVGVILLGLTVGAVSRLPGVKRFLGD
jgi:hypothetical protein